jgi:hypothetical protein
VGAGWEKSGIDSETEAEPRNIEPEPAAVIVTLVDDPWL